MKFFLKLIVVLPFFVFIIAAGITGLFQVIHEAVLADLFMEVMTWGAFAFLGIIVPISFISIFEYEINQLLKKKKERRK